MYFNDVLEIVSDCLDKTGSAIDKSLFDGIIVKKLEASNTLDKGRTTNQSHIAITGSQMDMFPYVRADGYFTEEYSEQDNDLKKYFVAQIPAYLHKENVDYLDSENIFSENEKLVHVSIVRSRRNGAADQIQMSMTNMDSPEFVTYRRMIHAGSYLIMLKRKETLMYDIYAVKQEDADSLKQINNIFVKLQTNTPVHIDEILNIEDDELGEDILNHTLFGIHIKMENDALSNDRPHICIGWSDMGDLTGITSKDELETKYKEVWPDKKARAVGQDVGQIWRFIKEAQAGDYVIYADGEYCHIGRITSDYYYDGEPHDGQSTDYVNTRDVDWLKTDVKRSDLSDAMHRSLMTAMSFWTMNDYRAAIADLINGTYVKDESVADDDEEEVTIVYKTNLSITKSRNRIVFGAPGTGKSFTINNERKHLLGDGNETDYERVTFHPDYTYANFVGTYKPVPCKDSNGNDAITYEYVPGPFMRVYVNALKNALTGNPKPYLLIIEEINRANVAAVFGDVFQLLDRDDNEVSEYPIQASEDIKKFLAKELRCSPDKVEKIKIPDNMFIWATMNSADQGVFPMDTAFKRRWDFTYIGIDDNDEKIQGKYVVLGSRTSQKVEWNVLRKAINNYLAKLKINEDKQLGPYFISRKIVLPENGDEIDRDRFCETFKSKVIMYLFEDAAKQKRPSLFEGCFSHASRYSEICREFDEHGLGIFNRDIILACDETTTDLTINNFDATQVAGTGENEE